MAKITKEYFLGDYLTAYYDCVRDEADPSKIGLPTATLAYVVIGLEAKFGRKFSYQEVQRLLKEEKIPRHKSDVAVPGT